MRARPSRGGFTLVEVAVTLIIVGITLLWVLEGMNRAKMTAAQTHNSKLAAELALQTLAEIESGLYWEEIDENGLTGNYAEEGYEAFTFEVVVGDETFTDLSEEEAGTLPYDTFAEKLKAKKEAERDADEDPEDEEEEEVEEVYERVKIRVTFPRMTEEKPEVVLERWIPWRQVYGETEEEAAAAEGGAGSGESGA
jgi:prepilin-type N-terminal cleavage/methylation domain-containing protein